MTQHYTSSGSQARTVSQRGVVESVEGNRAFVRIYQDSACGSCHLQGGCGSKSLGGSTGRLVEAVAEDGVGVGSAVDLRMKTADGILSVLLSFVMPLALVFTIILSFQSRGMSEELLAAMALGSIALYYTVLSLFRKALKARISFTATLLNDSVTEACELH